MKPHSDFSALAQILHYSQYHCTKINEINHEVKKYGKSNCLKLKLFPFSHIESMTLVYGLIFQQSVRLKITKDY